MGVTRNPMPETSSGVVRIKPRILVSDQALVLRDTVLYALASPSVTSESA